MLPVALFDPNVAFLLLLAGALAIGWEVHAPGLFIPGLVGLGLLFLATFALYRDSPTFIGAVLVSLALFLLFVELRVYTHMISGLAGSVLLAIGAMVLFSGPRRIAPALAVSLAVASGIITVFLGYLGMRTRNIPAATGLQTLVDGRGVAQTDINPEGFVLIHGEYWRAHSTQLIAAGMPVQVRRIQGLTLFVEAI